MKDTKDSLPLKSIEERYPVEHITYNDEKLWPIFRTYIGGQLWFKKDTVVKPSSSLLKLFFKYFFKGFKNIFRSYDYLVISTSDQRKNINGKMVDRFDCIDNSYGKGLFIETPIGGHYPKKKTPSKIVSHIPLYCIEFICSKLTFLKRKKTRNLELIKRIEQEYHVNINETYLIKRYLSQKRTMRLFLKIWKPKTVFITTPYTKAGYIKAFKEKDIKVIEAQHGVISSSHFAYNVYKNVDDSYYPNYLLSFGEHEKSIFQSSYYVNLSNVLPTGSFYVDYIASSKRENRIKKRFPEYQKYVAVVLQDAYDKALLDHLTPAFKRCNETLFVLIPRNKSSAFYSENYKLPTNCIFINDLNTYEIIKDCDVHTTINSTTALEAPALGTINLLVNHMNLSKTYFLPVLSDKKITIMVDNSNEYIRALKQTKVTEPNVIKDSYLTVFKSGFKANLNKHLELIEKSH